jgi:YD repeat-containing protein
MQKWLCADSWIEMVAVIRGIFARPHATGFGKALSPLVAAWILALPLQAGTTTYVYDVHGRLKTVTSPNGSDQTIANQTYDNASNRVSSAHFLGSTPPTTPMGVSAVALASDQIRVSWTPSLDAGGGPVSYYRIYRGGQLVASPSFPPFDDWPLSHNTAYSYRVSAVDAASNQSAQSAAVNATTPSDTTPPAAPANFSGAPISDTRVDLSWSPSQDTGGSGLGGYHVFRNGGAESVCTASSASTGCSDQSASSGTTYTYLARAVDGAANFSSDSNQISVTTLDSVPPSAPGDPSFSSISLETAVASWTAATDSSSTGVTGYRYSLNSGANWTTQGNVTSTTLTGLQAGTSYTMLVQARDTSANWGPSSSGAFATNSAYITIADGTRPPIVRNEHMSTYGCGYFIDYVFWLEYEYCGVIGGGDVFYVSYEPAGAPWVATGYSWSGYFLVVDSSYYGTW